MPSCPLLAPSTPPYWHSPALQLPVFNTSTRRTIGLTLFLTTFVCVQVCLPLLCGSAGMSSTLRFSPTAFFYGLLPPIVFAAGAWKSHACSLLPAWNARNFRHGSS